MLGLRTADFEHVLARKPCARSTHFAIHHAPSSPVGRRSRATAVQSGDLSTGDARNCPQAVDEPAFGVWLGTVVPKRHARRAVTRNLIRRQIQAAFERRSAALARGVWLVRLRAPFDSKTWTSATSPGLQAAARDELDRLVQQAEARI